MNAGLITALTTGLTTGLSPAQTNIQNLNTVQPTEQDNSFFYVLIIAALIIAAGTIYFVIK